MLMLRCFCGSLGAAGGKVGVSRGFTGGHKGLCQAEEGQVHRDQALPCDPSAAVHEPVPIPAGDACFVLEKRVLKFPVWAR